METLCLVSKKFFFKINPKHDFAVVNARHVEASFYFILFYFLTSAYRLSLDDSC